MKHKWYFSKESNEIYNRDQQRLQRYFIQSINNNRYEINEDSKERCNNIPNDALPITYIEIIFSNPQPIGTKRVS